ncbi:MAG: hypothetical protein NTV94_14050 [Planctomycetota bacterium]|nr:hypothetical protein [Planctomycetota bacterium]
MSGREDRRGEILGLMHEALEARVRTRRMVRGGGALLMIVLVVVGLRAVRLGGASGAGSVREEAAPMHAAVDEDAARPGEVAVDGAGKSVAQRSVVKVTVVERAVVPGSVYVDDAQLEGLLREAGQPVGLIRVAGKRPVVLSEMALVASAGR